jgi:hypothetical protein
MMQTLSMRATLLMNAQEALPSQMVNIVNLKMTKVSPPMMELVQRLKHIKAE